MTLRDELKREVGHTQLRRLETLTDCAYAVALVLIIQWLPLPSESATGGVRVLLAELFTEFAGNLVSIGIAVAFVIIYWLFIRPQLTVDFFALIFFQIKYVKYNIII